MSRSACDRFHHTYAVNTPNRFQPACRRCGAPLWATPDRKDHPFSRDGAQATVARPPTFGDANPPSALGHQWTKRSVAIASMLGLCLAGAVLLRRGCPVPPVMPPPPTAPPIRLAAAQEARREYFRAKLAVVRQMDALEEWDPQALDNSAATALFRRRMLAASPELQRARKAARQGLTLARTPHETCRILWLLARIECDLGDHPAELKEARRAMALEPRDEMSLITLRRAAQCNHRQLLEQQADAPLRTPRRRVQRP